MSSTFANIGLQGHSVGSLSLSPEGVKWTDRGNNTKEFKSNDLEKVSWNVYGQRGYLRLDFTDGDWTRFDGFAKSEYEGISEYIKAKWGKDTHIEFVSSEGASFGDLTLRHNTVQMKSLVSDKTIFEMKIDQAAQAVVPQSNRNDLEIQFLENDSADKEEESIVQMTLHFPLPDVDENGNVDDVSPAQAFQTEIMKTGVIKSVKGDVICEFSKEVGNFVSPRGKYAMQMTSTYLHMQGAQYTYKIKYTDITSLFLLDKPDGLRMAFVICLSLPIRQGAQKYQYLVLETHKMEHTVELNLTEEEIEANESYKGNLTPVIRASMATCIAKLFKVLSETPVYVPKAFKSFREDFCIRCTYKTNDGFLYPLAKSVIFINKPTILASYDDIEYLEFQRYTPTANSATKNFDILIGVKSSQSVGGKTENSFLFTGIDRSEYNYLFDFFESKKINILNPQKGMPETKAGRGAGAFAGMDMGGDDDDDDEEEDDGDYKAGESSDSSNDSDDSGSDDGVGGGGSDNEGITPKATKKAPKKPREPKAKGSPKAPRAKGEKKAKKKKDPNAPKGKIGSYMFFTQAMRAVVKAQHPEMKVTELAKEMGARWKALDAAAKEPFEEQARADKERYAAEMKAYNERQAVTGADLGSDSDDDMDVA